MTKHTKGFLLYILFLIASFPIGILFGAIADEWLGWSYNDATMLAVLIGGMLMGCLGATALWYMHFKYERGQGKRIPQLLRIRFSIVNWSLVITALLLIGIAVFY